MSIAAFDETQIREKAYLIWLEEGQPAGRDQAHWDLAIEALSVVAPKTRAPRKTAKPKLAKAASKPAAKAKKPASKTKPAAKSAK